jgi:hypothetical protein
MSKESLKKFFTDLNEKEELKKGLADYCDKAKTDEESVKLFAEYAKKNGYDVTENEINDCLVAGSSADGKVIALNDEELAAVAGGGFGKTLKKIGKGALYVLGFTNTPDW